MQSAGSARSSRARPGSRALVLASANLAFLLICASPAIYMFSSSFIGRDGGFTLSNYSRILAEPRQRDLLLTSGTLGVGAALLATALGAPLGLLLARADLPLRRLLRVLLSVPLVIPPYILALSWILLTSPSGMLTHALGRDALARYTNSPLAAALVLGIAFYPIVMLATEAAARRVNGRLEEVALLVAPRSTVIRKITLPLIAPATASAALIVFVLAISEFGVPGLLRVRVFTTEVFTAFAALYDYGAATALSAPLLLLVLAAALVARSIIGEHFVTHARTARTGLPIVLGNLRPLVLAGIVMVLFICVIAPLIALTREVRDVRQFSEATASSAVAVWNSLYLSIAGAVAVTALGLLLGYQRARTRPGLGRWHDLVYVTLFAIPSTVVGVGIIGLWNRPAVPIQIYASNLTVLIAYMARFVPVAALILAASMRQIPYSSEEGAQIAGAHWMKTFTQIVLPQMIQGIAAAFVVSFVFVFGELGATVLVAPPGESTLPVRVYTLIANAPMSEVAALALLQSAAVLIPLALLGFYGHLRGEEKQS